MPGRALILVSVIALALIIATAGCMEVKDRPEEGSFTIHLDGPPMYVVEEGEHHLHGAHAHVDTDLHHDHVNQTWNVSHPGAESQEEVEDVDLEGAEVNISVAEYNLGFYEQVRTVDVFLAIVPGDEEFVLVVADASRLEDGGDGAPGELPFSIDNGPEVEMNQTHDWGGFIITGPAQGHDVAVLTLILPPDATEHVELVLALRMAEGGGHEEHIVSFKLMPGERHVFYTTEEHPLSLYVSEHNESTNRSFQGAFEDMPPEYHTNLGSLEWEGDVGKEDEAPGLAASAATTAVLTAALLRRRTRPARLGR